MPVGTASVPQPSNIIIEAINRIGDPPAVLGGRQQPVAPAVALRHGQGVDGAGPVGVEQGHRVAPGQPGDLAVGPDQGDARAGVGGPPAPQLALEHEPGAAAHGTEHRTGERGHHDDLRRLPGGDGLDDGEEDAEQPGRQAEQQRRRDVQPAVDAVGRHEPRDG